jgi:radical SAM protein with 4Fe4S-binding SPASM domain
MSNFLKVVNAYANPNKIGYVIFYVTNMCNFRCNFCFYSEEIQKGLKKNLLTLDEINTFSKSLNGLLQLSLTGGEPFLRKDFDQITDIFITNTSVKFITIPTNASLQERMVRYLEYILPKFKDTFIRLTFSVDGIGKDHDENRSMPGSFQKIKEAYEAIGPLRKKYENLVLDTNTVFTSKTEKNFTEIIDYLEKNFDFDNHSITYARGNIPDEAMKTNSKTLYVKAINHLKNIERKKEKRFLYPLYRGVRDTSWENLIATVFDDKFVTPCVAGKKLIVVSEEGEVFPCEILGKDKMFGNLRDYDLQIYKLLKNYKSKDVTKWIKDTKCKCSFECALSANVTWNFSQYPKLIKNSIRNIGSGFRDY